MAEIKKKARRGRPPKVKVEEPAPVAEMRPEPAPAEAMPKLDSIEAMAIEDIGGGGAMPTPAEGERDYLSVVGPRRGFWRAKRKFGLAAVLIPLDDLSEADFDALSNEPRLTVEMVRK